MRKTTANRLFKAITDNLVSVASVVVNHDKCMKESISDENSRGFCGFIPIRAYFPIQLIFVYKHQ